jgi:hypothetical protein
MRNLHTVLVNDYGLNLTGWQLSSARGVSPDGTFIVGNGINPSGQYEAWLASLRPPALACHREAANLLLLWPTNTPGWVLEQASGLGPASLWTTNSAPIGQSGTSFVVTNDLSAQQQFFRLTKP